MTIKTVKDVKLFEHISPEALRQQNAEFLAQYPTDDAQIAYYTELAMRLWAEFEIDGAYEPAGTRKNIETWFANKRNQMELFRQHPYWCEEAKAIIFAYKEARKCDFVNAQREMHRLRVYIHDNHTHCCRNGDAVLCAVENTLEYMRSEYDDHKATMTSRFAHILNLYIERDGANVPKAAARMLSAGTKIARFVRKCCETFEAKDKEIIDATKLEDEHEPGDRSFDSFEKHFAKFSDALSEIENTRVAFMSLNFLDFMTMSNGNSWSTCQYINSHGLFHHGESTYHGMHKQGCMSYALDEPSFIFYTLPNDLKANDYYRCKKLTRMCCQYADGALITGKCYPNNEIGLIEQYVSMLQNVISTAEKSTSEWEVSDSTNKIACIAATAERSAHYQDYLLSHQRPTISLCKKFVVGEEKRMTIGHRAYCLYCGKEIGSNNGSEWLQCDRHRRRMVCAKCGKKLTDDIPYHDVGGNYYCGDCMFYCAVHGRYEDISEPHRTILMADGEKQVCDAGMESLAQCVDCGVYGFKDNMLNTTRGYSCKKHVRRYKKCQWCGKYVPNKEVHEKEDGVIYCAECDEMLGDMSGICMKKKAKYEVGDYVVIADDLSNCVFGLSDEMEKYYPGRIVKIGGISKDPFGRGTKYNVSILDPNSWHSWSWCKNCFDGAVIGVNDGFIGKKFSEITR